MIFDIMQLNKIKTDIELIKREKEKNKSKIRKYKKIL